jgi:flavodoxin/Pyruvate/2-oxoacid:ferredoxin oxidoreductase delta subunit
MNKIEIFYFSGTGNSLYVAKYMQSFLSNVKLTPILHMLKDETIRITTDVVGFIFPMYLATMPKPVIQFFKKIDTISSKYIFCIETRGGTISDSAFILTNILKAKRATINAFYHINVHMNSGVLGEKYKKPSNEEMQLITDKMHNILLSVKQNIINRTNHLNTDTDFFIKIPLWKKIFIVPFRFFFRPLIFKAWEAISYYSDDKCTGCKTCEKICLSQRIIFKVDKPEWQKYIRCFCCLACINYCPNKSIQVKSSIFLKSHTANNDRYSFPGIYANEISNQK